MPRTLRMEVVMNPTDRRLPVWSSRILGLLVTRRSSSSLFDRRTLQAA